MLAALMLAEVEAGVGLWPSVFWGSWCILGQTHETSHVDGAGRRARLCIYLMVSLAGCRSSSFPDSRKMEAPSGGSRWKGKIAPVAQIVLAENSKVRSVAAVFACRSWSI
jgi:hypothetical protein